MQKLFALISIILLNLVFKSHAQIISLKDDESPLPGKTVKFDVSGLNQAINNAGFTNGLTSKFETAFPMPDGSTKSFTMDETLISTELIKSIKTFDGTADKGRVKMKLTLNTENRMTGIMHTPEGYFYIEPKAGEQNEFLIYSMSETPSDRIQCGTLDEHMNEFMEGNKGRVASMPPFPVGSQLRTYRMAAAATGEFVTHYGSQSAALTRIVEVMNAANLIYELETSIRFQLISATTSHAILFINSGTDPFTPDPNFASATASQNGFNNMHLSGILNYSTYDVGHTFHVYPPSSPSSYSAQGQAGPTPCQNTGKSRGWTQWSNNALSASGGLSMVVGIFVHEVGHQFSAWHTYNAVGGSVGSPTFCTGGWSSDSAVEPGSGSTLMGYGSNCSHPNNYVLTGDNNLNYFHTKSQEQIFYAVNGSSGTCITNSPTGNTPPVANAGSDITIPKGTPFILQGSATDANVDLLTYTWDQMDVATANDRGAFGSTVNGVGGYSAVNSATAPLFRSRQSSSKLRTFPDMGYILNSQNDPPVNSGEALPQVARNMKFRFTVRDNSSGGGGVDSDEVIVSVNNTGPFVINSFNSPQTISAGSSQTINWSVNGTNALAANVKISLSIDGGNSFNYILAFSTPNDGSETIAIPSYVPASSNARIKISADLGTNAQFFDINNADITITSSCNAQSSFICSDATVTGSAGSGVFNLGLSRVFGEVFNLNSKQFSYSGSTPLPIVNYTNNTMTTCQTQSWSPQAKVVRFRVTQSGNYNVMGTRGTGSSTTVVSVHNSSALNCSSFISSNSHSSVSWSSSQSVFLEECITYYAVVYNLYSESEFNLRIMGSGSVIEVLNDPSGFNYTYVAVGLADNTIKAVSATSNFTSLSGGDYEVLGLSYVNTFNTSTLNGKTMSEALALGSCILFSSNSKILNIVGNPCPPALSLSGAASPGKRQASVSVTSTQVVNSGQNVSYQAADYILLEPQSGSGFEATEGSVFKAEIKNCD
jgi:hypothetical protein